MKSLDLNGGSHKLNAQLYAKNRYLHKQSDVPGSTGNTSKSSR